MSKKIYFKPEEFLVHCSADEIDELYKDRQLVNNLIKLAEFMQSIREVLGEPVIITSGYRDYEHNEAVGGVLNSHHMFCRACDFVVKSENPDYQRIAKVIDDNIEYDQMIIYRSFIHISYSDHFPRKQIINF